MPIIYLFYKDYKGTNVEIYCDRSTRDDERYNPPET